MGNQLILFATAAAATLSVLPREAWFMEIFEPNLTAICVGLVCSV